MYLELDRSNDPALAPRPPTLAQKTKEFSRQFQEKAKNEGLARSRKLGEELEQIARQGVERKALDDQFRRELAAMTQKFADSARSAGQSDAAAQTRERLKDLQAELEAARDFAELPELAKGAAESERGWSERLAGLPQLKRELEKLGGTGTRSDIRAFLDKLEQQVASELDRRALNVSIADALRCRVLPDKTAPVRLCHRLQTVRWRDRIQRRLADDRALPGLRLPMVPPPDLDEDQSGKQQESRCGDPQSVRGSPCGRNGPAVNPLAPAQVPE